MANDQELLNYIRDDIKAIKVDISKIRENGTHYMLKSECANLEGKCDQRLANFVTKSEFSPVKYVVFSLVMVVLTQVVRMLLANGIIK